jgi:hypothetical protein
MVATEAITQPVKPTCSCVMDSTDLSAFES